MVNTRLEREGKGGSPVSASPYSNVRLFQLNSSGLKRKLDKLEKFHNNSSLNTTHKSNINQIYLLAPPTITKQYT